MTVSSHVAIVGAGPYGLSIASHLQARGIDFRIFGRPLRTWRECMPMGMFLKSEGFASNLYDPDGICSLASYCVENGLPYRDFNSPISLDTFTSYALSFQTRLVPNVEDKSVIALRPAEEGFILELDDGEMVTARRVVVAVGVSHFGHIPPELVHLPGRVLSHSSDHRDLSEFKSRNVSVIGGGSSALDVVASLRSVGADVQLIARRQALRWNLPAPPRPAWRRWPPLSELGGGWRNYFFVNAPMLFGFLPQSVRMHIVRASLGPAGGWPAKDSVERAPLLLGHTIRQAICDGSGVHLDLIGPSGEERIVRTDYVIAATGYKVDLRRLAFLQDFGVRGVEHTPILSANFESSMPGLYFVGLASANTFGPAMRFLVGARYTAQKLARHFAAADSRHMPLPARRYALPTRRTHVAADTGER